VTDALVGRVVSLQVGRPQTLESPQGREWRTAIYKTPIEGRRVPLGPENFAGDYQANRKYHGGPDKAVCVYAVEHYPDWCSLLDPTPMPFGAFGRKHHRRGFDRRSGLRRRRFHPRNRVRADQPAAPAVCQRQQTMEPARPARPHH
jgi:MOSC domain-containing protein YiiM